MNFLKNEDAIIQGGVFVLITIITAMVVLITILPIVSSILPHLQDMDTSEGRFDNMRNRIDTSISIFEIFPMFCVISGFIFFLMRTIRKQSYGRYNENDR